MAGPFLIVLVTLTMPAARAQDQNTQAGQQNQNEQPADQSAAAPIPAYHSPLASAGNDSDAGTEELQPDTRSLSGVQNLSLGGLKTSHSYWQPRVDIFESADSNTQETAGGSSWGAWTSLTGGVDVHHISGNTDLRLSYTGGGTFSGSEGTSNGMVQQLDFNDRITLRRWTITLLDQLSYLPESAIGYGGYAGASVPGSTIGVPGTTGGAGSAFLPGVTIALGQGRSVWNSFATEGDFALTPRTSLTFVGGYSLLAYPDDDLLNTWNASARVGYNYLWTPKDTVSVFYTYSGLRYPNFDQSIDAHTFQASYGRRVTGRLAFQVAVGPGIALSRFPISSNGMAVTPGANSTSANSTQFFLSLDTSVTYQLRRVVLGLRYDHGVSSGSGVLAGSYANSFEGSATRQMSPTFTSTFMTGYSRNSGTTIGAGVPTNQAYNYWYVGADLTHPLGNLGLTFSYQLQYQNSNLQFCTSNASCGTSLIRNLISVGASWHGGRMLLR
jgi:hypothetical protein